MMMEGGEQDSKRPETELSSDIVGKLYILLTESDDESEFSNEGLVDIQEEKLEEIMQELYKEIITTSSFNVSPPPTATLPSSSSPLSLPSLPFFGVSDVKSESCGASMSDSSSTVMAGVEFVGPAGKLPELKEGLPENELWVMELGFKDNNVGGGEEQMEGCDEVEVGDDQWLARVLRWSPLDIEEVDLE
ncbi:hypothetical protein REPUB_Repub18cG0137100 [Reevesia pubescens]